ncbi:hypothetical protein C8R44DRAFT_870254 [Mycena epipterygia]|nr:hypothetical protein C8R44DRAFT_870254 [Mycena epipterygia]
MNIEAALAVVGAQKVDSYLLDTLNYRLHCLRKKFWGTTLSTDIVWDMETEISAFRLTEGKLLLFHQYPGVLEKLRKQRTKDSPYWPDGMLITGSPGIGKTSCLWYLLLTHLSLAEPVVFYYDETLHVFTDSGLYALDLGSVAVLESKVFRGVLCLLDMDMKDSQLRSRIMSRSCQCFTVAASSPGRERYHYWLKQCNIGVLVLDSPKRDDFINLAKLANTKDLRQFESRLDGLLGVFGPNIRDLLPVIYESDDALQISVDMHIKKISEELQRLGKDSLKLLFTYPDTIPSVFSHTLVHTYGVSSGKAFRDDIQHRIRSPLILRLVLQLVQLKQLSDLREMYDVFSASSNLAVSRGWAFEILCHEKLCGIGVISLHPMVKQGGKLRMVDSDSSSVATDITIGPREVHIYTASARLEATTSTSRYYIPAEGNNPTFDSFIPGEDSLAFQMFIARKHSLKRKGMDMVRKRLRAFDGNRDWKTNKIKFVFVIPVGSVFEVDAPTWNLKDVEFYTLELDVGDNYKKFDEAEEHSEEDVDDSKDAQSDGDMDID